MRKKRQKLFLKRKRKEINKKFLNNLISKLIETIKIQLNTQLK